MPVLPFHRYIGPGNDIDNGPCVDADDCIARKHDIKYENAKTPQDIRVADVEAINEFRENWKSGNWHSIIGDVGLSIKYCVETYTGVLYPKLVDYQPCEILPLFHDLLKLHCVNRARQINRFGCHFSTLTSDQPKIHLYDFSKPNDEFTETTVFFILIAWYQLCHQKHISFGNCHEHHDSQAQQHLSRFSNHCHIKPNKELLENSDIFHVKAWLRFFTLFQFKKIDEVRDKYNDEEFSNMFMQYD